MRKILVSVSTGYVGCKKTEEIEVEDDMTDDEIDEAAREVMFTMIEWDWQPAEEATRRK